MLGTGGWKFLHGGEGALASVIWQAHVPIAENGEKRGAKSSKTKLRKGRATKQNITPKT